ncbi:MAG: hypothetical protein NTZ87_02350 [Candidatus Nomurabacteria bacterium]|nr:hypothetical protein [Candidatus Nomurabacteria bacterium]
MKQNCKKCKHNFTLDQDDLSFYEKMSAKGGSASGGKVPPPKVCPDCRFKMRALFRNETTLYSGRKCALCGKRVVTMYNPKSPYIIYCYDCFYSDKWDARDYAMDYDEGRSFLEQVKEFMIKVPRINLAISPSEGQNINTEYANSASGCKNCYMIFNSSPCENTLYSKGLKNSRDCSDLYFGKDIEQCYECVNVHQSSKIIWGQNINGSVDSYFILNCRNLMNCFGCVNLNSKSHYFLNKPMAPNEYKNKVNEIMGSYEKMQKFLEEFKKFVLNFPMRENNNIKTINSTGDYLFGCKNVKDSFEATNAEDSKYLFYSKEAKDSIGTIGYGTQSERLLETVSTGHSSNIIGSFFTHFSQDILYGYMIRNCQNCIACDGLKNGQYCILNKQYTKEDYERLKEKIINELKEKDLYGLMMPPELAPFAYNESIAQDNFPLTKEEVISQGFRWEDDIQKTEGKETMKPEDIPDHIKDVKDSITDEILKCVSCNRNYKIINQELSFYRKMNIPIPRRCFYCRHQDRITRRGPYKFWSRNCDKCKKEIMTNYAPDRPEIIYCEKCYQQEVY